MSERASDSWPAHEPAALPALTQAEIDRTIAFFRKHLA